MPVPDEVQCFIEASGAVIFPENIEKTAGIALRAQTAEDFLHHNGAVPLPPTAWVGVEGDQFPPGGQVRGAEGTDGVRV